MTERTARYSTLIAGVIVLAALAGHAGGCLGPQTRSTTTTTETASLEDGADLVIVNARIWTGAAGTASEPTAIAVRDGRILALGDDGRVRQHVSANTHVIDAAGRRVIPGITDSHTHIVSGGFQLVRPNLRNAANREEFVAIVADAASAKKPGQWVLGGRWTVDSWTDPAPPNKSWLDPVTNDVPVFVSRMDGHSALVNSAALKLAGIDATGPADPQGGEIERSPATGEPTGILKESAMGLVSRHIPDPSPQQRYEALLRAMGHANSLGVTSVHDMCSESDLAAFRRAKDEEALTVRITAYLSTSDWAGYVDRLPTYRLHDDWVRLAGFKGYMDGSLGSRTAYMREPYRDATSDTPYPRGQLTAMADPPAEFQQLVAAMDAKGVQLAVHAIGDEGNHLLLDAYEYAIRRNGWRNTRHRDEHTQHLHVSDIPRFTALGVVASMQPYHKADDGRYAEDALGRSRLEGSYAFRQLVDAGALVIFGSDWPVVTMNPFAGMASAVNARTLDGKTWLPSHSLTVEEALHAYTVAPPKAIHRESRLGTLAPGNHADMVILDRDVLSIPEEQLADVRVVKTIVGGKVVFTR